MQFITLIGHNNSGKSTTAKAIKKILASQGYLCCVKSFATPLKELAVIYFNYDETKKFEQRQLLEDLATNLKDLFGKELFGYTLLDNCRFINVDYVIIDDLRYKEEYKVISEFYPAFVIKVPDAEYIDELDDDRLLKLLWYFDCNDVPYSKMRDFSAYTLEQILDKLK